MLMREVRNSCLPEDRKHIGSKFDFGIARTLSMFAQEFEVIRNGILNGV
jgi:hypothetical protein